MGSRRLLQIISLILIVCSLNFFMIVANATSKDEKNIAYYKQIITEKYGGDKIIDDGLNYSWDYNEVTNITELVENQVYSIPVATPYWYAGTSSSNYSVHGKIIDNANKGTVNKIPEKYLESVVKVVCQWCDTKWYIYEKDENKNFIYDSNGNKVKNEKAIEAIHGVSNYLATLKYLQKFAKVIAKHETGANITTDVNEASRKALAQLPDNVKTEGTVVGDMVAQLDNMTKRIIKAHYKVTDSHPTQTEGGKCKYIIIGMLMHFFGDICAHRLIVPKTSVESFRSDFNNSNFNAKKMFYKSDFTSSERTKLTNAIEARVATFSQIKNYVSPSSTIYNQLNSKYVDNGDFYPGRVTEAVIIATNFLNWYSGGFVPDLLDPYDFTIEKFDTYLNAIES